MVAVETAGTYCRPQPNAYMDASMCASGIGYLAWRSGCSLISRLCCRTISLLALMESAGRIPHLRDVLEGLEFAGGVRIFVLVVIWQETAVL